MIVFTQPNVRTQMAKSKIQRNHANGFRSKARLGVAVALKVLPEDIVACATRANIHTCSGRRLGLAARSLTFFVRNQLSARDSELAAVTSASAGG